MKRPIFFVVIVAGLLAGAFPSILSAQGGLYVQGWPPIIKFKQVTILFPALGTTSTDGLISENTTAATAGVPVQISPRAKWCGTAWNSTAVASETNCFFLEALPATVAGTTTATLKLGYIAPNGTVTYPMQVTSAGQWLLTDGTATAPSLTFASDLTKGFFSSSANAIGVSANAGVERWRFDGNNDSLILTSSLGFGTAVTTQDTFIVRDGAANILAQRNGTNAQEFRPYGYYVSASSFTMGSVKSVTAAVSVSGASTATSNIIPVGAFVVGVATTTTTTITGASGYTVGDGTDVDRYGDITGTAVGTDSDNTNSTANPTGYNATASAITLTAKTSNFTGGVVQVTVFYLTTAAD